MNTRPSRKRTRVAAPQLFELAGLIGLMSMLMLSSGGLHWVAYVLLAAWVVVTARAVGFTPDLEALLEERILICGSGRTAAALIDEIESAGGGRRVVVGVVDAAPPKHRRMNRHWLGPFARLSEIVERTAPSTIVVALDDRRGQLPLDRLLECRVHGVPVEDAQTFYERLTGKIAIEALTPAGLIFAGGFRNRGLSRHAARIISVVCAGVGLVALSPVMALIALAIKLDSPGPVLFVQERVGKDGRPFAMLKFRTMMPDRYRASEWVRDNHHRITRVGRWLRRCRADELPQLVNVLRGEMNLVGPRPHPTCNVGIFSDRIHYYRCRSAVLPGLTGWAQIRQGYANDLQEETEKMRYDLYYIKNHSVWFDLRILVATIGILVHGRGATAVHAGTLPRGFVPAPIDSARPMSMVGGGQGPRRVVGPR